MITPAPTSVYALHLVYGLVFTAAGVLQFVEPSAASELLNLTIEPFPAAPAVLSQTSGLITAVLGIYSLVASLGRWDLVFFRMNVVPKLVVALTFAWLTHSSLLPSTFWIYAISEGLLGLLTFLLLPNSLPPLRTQFNLLTFAQVFHAIPSGTFALLMTFAPQSVLHNIVPDILDAPVDSERYRNTLIWARVMGASEFTMTWLYTFSGVIVGLDPFAKLSVYTRYGALLTLFSATALGRCTLTQSLGCLPDGLLASFTLYALLRARRAPTIEKKDL